MLDFRLESPIFFKMLPPPVFSMSLTCSRFWNRVVLISSIVKAFQSETRNEEEKKKRRRGGRRASRTTKIEEANVIRIPVRRTWYSLNSLSLRSSSVRGRGRWLLSTALLLAFRGGVPSAGGVFSFSFSFSLSVHGHRVHSYAKKQNQMN